MSDKLLTPEEVNQGGFEYEGDMVDALLDYVERANATVKVACARLARVEVCEGCSGTGEFWITTERFVPCPDCDGFGRPHRTWQDACRSLSTKEV